MATVPFSGKLMSDIKTAAAAPFIAQMAEAKHLLETDQELRDQFILGLGTSPAEYEKAKHLTSLNPKWTANTNSRVYMHRDDSEWFTIFLENCSPMGPYDDARVHFKKGERPDMLPRFEELLKPYDRAKKDKDEMDKVLDTIFESCSNLNRALEVMPSIRNWTPPDVLTRLAAKPPKAAKRATAEEIKAAAFTPEALAAMARARMSDP